LVILQVGRLFTHPIHQEILYIEGVAFTSHSHKEIHGSF
jgi:hypothetical protein